MTQSVQLLGSTVEARLERLVTTLDGIEQGFQVIGFDWRYLYVNVAAARHARCGREALLGHTLTECFPGIECTELFAELKRCMETRDASVFENLFSYADGTSTWFELRVEPCVDGISVLSSDLTRRKQLEARLLQAQKMEAIGRLAGGVAHDFNNILSVILSYAGLLLEDLPVGDRHREDVREIHRAGERGGRLTKQLLSFSRQRVMQPRLLDLNALLSSIGAMVRRIVGEDIRLRVRTTPALGLVRADQGLMEQVLLNLVVNARDAMPRGGTLTLETTAAVLDEAYQRTHPSVTPGPHVVLAVSDTGAGMDEATQARIFEPFFTTKELGQGTGLGLATVFGIVSQAGGTIWVYSEPGLGTTFKVYLPRVEGSLPESAAAPTPARSTSGTETILLAEDDAQVRGVAEQILERAGYRVLTASSGAAALEQAATESTIHLLLTDVVMPDLNGRELAEALGALRPGLKVLFMTGYTQNHVAHRHLLGEGVQLLEKPLTPEALLARVRDVLDLAGGP